MIHKRILFEYSLFRDGTPDHIEEIDDIEFIINTLVSLSKFRPLKYEIIFILHQNYSAKIGFREKFLERVLKHNCAFVNILIKKNIYKTEDIEHHFNKGNETLNIVDLSKKMASIVFPEIESGYLSQNISDLSAKLIETSYSPGTIEYCLKYDDIDEIRRFYQNPNFYQDQANIIPTENIMDLNFDLLGFCGFFGSVNCFKFFLETQRFSIDQSVIECVVCGGSIEIFRLCIQTIDISGYSLKLLFMASCYNNLDLLRYLHENGVDLNSKEIFYNTPIHYAAENGHLGVVDYLINQGADINAKTKDDYTPLHFAALNGHLGVVEYLVYQGADINSQIRNGIFFFLTRHLIILLLLMVIQVLLNIWLFKKLKSMKILIVPRKCF